MFVKYSCGCMGFPPDQGKALVIHPCDDGLPAVRDISFQTLEPCHDLAKEIIQAFADARKYRAIKEALQ